MTTFDEHMFERLESARNELARKLFIVNKERNALLVMCKKLHYAAKHGIGLFNALQDADLIIKTIEHGVTDGSDNTTPS